MEDQNDNFAATIDHLQTQMTAVQAALEGNSQITVIKPRPFNGLPSEDLNEWLLKIKRFAKFYNWTNPKKLCAISLLLDGPALAWLHTQDAKIVNNYNNLVEALKSRFGARNLDFIFRQELYSRRQGVQEPLPRYTADIIKMCQCLEVPDKDMMNIFINGLSHDIKNYVILNQPDTFVKAEILARLRDAVVKNTPALINVALSHEQRIKKLEGQMNLFHLCPLSVCKHKAQRFKP